MVALVLKTDPKGHHSLGLGLLSLMFSDTCFRNPTTILEGGWAHMGVPAECPDGLATDSLPEPLDL